MSATTPVDTCDAMVIGSGLAAMAAALFAAHHRLRVIQAGHPGDLALADGTLELLAVHPVKENRLWQDPWKALAQLQRDLPDHPYAKIDPQLLKSALDHFTRVMRESGMPFHSEATINQSMVTAAGTLKPTWAVLESMHAGVAALKQQAPALIVDIKGLKGFSARQIVANLRSLWPDLRATTLTWPESRGEIYAENMAYRLETPAGQDQLAKRLAPLVKENSVVGLPAILGIHNTTRIMARLERKIGVSLFEIPTIPPYVTAIRLREASLRALKSEGVITCDQPVTAVRQLPARGFELTLESGRTVTARAVILATGRFLTGGLDTTRSTVVEPLFNLPVRQPASRALWHRKTVFPPEGHPLQTAGIATDSALRPLDDNNDALHTHLAVAGTILAGHRWSRQKCGAGLSIGTAWLAAQTIARALLPGKAQ